MLRLLANQQDNLLPTIHKGLLNNATPNQALRNGLLSGVIITKCFRQAF